MHFVSHVYHSLSDLSVDVSSAPPRRIQAPSRRSATIIQQTIPVLQVCLLSVYCLFPVYLLSLHCFVTVCLLSFCYLFFSGKEVHETFSIDCENDLKCRISFFHRCLVFMITRRQNVHSKECCRVWLIILF